MIFKHAYALGIAIVALPMFAQPGLLGTKAADGSVKFQTVEDFNVAQSDKIRLMPAATQTLDPNQLKNLQKVDIERVRLIRRESSGRIVQLADKGAGRSVVLSDKMQSKAAVPAASAQERLLLDYLPPGKKVKTRETVTPEAFFVYVPGLDPDRAAFDLVNSDWAFESLDEQLAAMAAFSDAFPASVNRPAFRENLERRLASGLGDFEGGGSYKDLLLTSRFVPLAKHSFPADANLTKLSETILGKISTVEAAQIELRSLAVAKYWDAYLTAFAKMEPYQSSFPDLQRLHERALEESTREHALRGRAFETRLEHDSSAEELARALTRDPGNTVLSGLRDSERDKGSELAARVAASKRTPPAPGSVQARTFRDELDFAQRAVRDKDFSRAEERLRNAAAADATSPEIVSTTAQLAYAKGQMREALNLLDNYDRLATDEAARQDAVKVRQDARYALSTKKPDLQKAARAAVDKGDYLSAGAQVKELLTMDDTDPETLFLAGTVLPVLRDGATAKKSLEKFLQVSDIVGTDMKRRDMARRLIDKVTEVKAPALSGGVNWMSGRREPPEAYYSPVSLAFQAPIRSIEGEKFTMNFLWKEGKLDNITTKFDDEKGKLGFVMFLQGAAPAQAPGAPETAVASPAPSSKQSVSTVDAGEFYFDYFQDGRLRNIRPKRLAKPESETYLTFQREKEGTVIVDSDQRARVVMPEDPQVNTGFLAMLETPVTTLVSGNAYFNPFIWDGVHYFAASYDSQGRVESAREWGSGNLLKFAWDGQKLTEIQVFHKETTTPFYKRTISYTEGRIASENYTGPTKGGGIKYDYNKGLLERATVDDNGVHDGHKWTATLAPLPR